MRIKDYLELNKLDREDKDYNIKVLEYFNIDYKKLSVKEVINKVKELVNIKPNEIKTDKIKINKKWFKIEKDITKASFSQFITMESYLSDESFFIEHLNEVLSIYVRPRIFNWKKLKFDIEPWDEKYKKKNDELLLEMDINDAFGLNVFFYQNAQDSIKNMKIHYLNEMMKKNELTMKLKS